MTAEIECCCPECGAEFSAKPEGGHHLLCGRNEAGPSVNGTMQRIASGKTIRANNTRAIGRVENDDRADWREAWALFPGDVAYVWHSSCHIGEVEASLLDAGLVVRSHLIWAKSQMVIGRGHYHYQHEPCWYAVRKGKTAHWAGDRTQTSVWQIDAVLPDSRASFSSFVVSMPYLISEIGLGIVTRSSPTSN